MFLYAVYTQSCSDAPSYTVYNQSCILQSFYMLYVRDHVPMHLHVCTEQKVDCNASIYTLYTESMFQCIYMC